MGEVAPTHTKISHEKDTFDGVVGSNSISNFHHLLISLFMCKTNSLDGFLCWLLLLTSIPCYYFLSKCGNYQAHLQLGIKFFTLSLVAKFNFELY